ncbi:MAG: efflux RND transporter periplasmic adaptor subunit [Gemmatimonadota bacterium]
MLLRRQAALVLACGLIAACSKTEEEAPVYRAVPVQTRDIVVAANAAGQVEPVTTIEVKSKASGEIIAVAVETGDRVEPGDLLVRVDQRIPGNALAQAQADLVVAQAQFANAESQLARSESLHESQIVTDEEFENARLAHANARASLIRAQRNLEDARIAYEDTEVRAPAAGIILSKTVEVGTVIQSASSNVSGGSVLLRMADLDTVQVRTLVDETDIGRVQPGLQATITVDAHPGRRFNGRVLKIEPEAVTQQNVTMFPVLTRIPNQEGLLRTGMSAEVEISIGRKDGVLTVPNAALRTPSDVSSAAAVLGLDMETVQAHLAAQVERDRVAAGGDPAGAGAGDATAGGDSPDEAGAQTVAFRGRQVTLPEGLTVAQVQPVLTKLESGGFQDLTDADRAIMQQIRGSLGGGQGGGRRPGGGGGGQRGGGQRAGGGGGGDDGGQRTRRPATSAADFGGEYVVFVVREGQPTATRVVTGLTDLDYSEVISGVSGADSVLVLPSSSLIQSQQSFQERVRGRTGLPGFSGS